MTWFAVPVSDGSIHILPDGDRGLHWADEQCPCMPEVRYEWSGPFGMSSGGLTIAHNSWDGREADEGSIASDKASDTMEAWSALDTRTETWAH